MVSQPLLEETARGMATAAAIIARMMMTVTKIQHISFRDFFCVCLASTNAVVPVATYSCAVATYKKQR